MSLKTDIKRNEKKNHFEIQQVEEAIETANICCLYDGLINLCKACVLFFKCKMKKN
jgi:hypothetical protein